MDFFQELSAGAQFNKKRFRNDIEVFKPTDKLKQDKVEVVDSLPSAINFFNTDGADNAAANKKIKLDENGKQIGSSAMEGKYQFIKKSMKSHNNVL
ncbi:hypothetical protein H4219_002269 [Mycoemilia scoparia]|uniref:Uncharacterized protein n=1 Tax=Mycoemilia scoparia TaxID=417184 RepID=A0A9W7ZYU2_9FUNG|nr:hypothetical protein H4219_002269 [Mycoemilia scoparia]